MKQEIRFTEAKDGVRIAYATSGTGPPLVKAANWLNHLEYDWESPIWRHLFEELGREHLLVRYDERGNGLSDWEVEDLSFEAYVRDLEAVVEACQIERFPLLGISQGGSVAIEYAVRHPERVSHLILFGTYARGWRQRPEHANQVERRQALLKLIETGWGQNNPAFRQVFTSLFIPGGTPEQMDWFNELQRWTTSPGNAVRLQEEHGKINVSERLSQVNAPTLVLHCDMDAIVPFEMGREVASGIPRARFIALRGRNHLLLEDEPAWPVFVQEVRDFLGLPARLTTQTSGTAVEPIGAPVTTGGSIGHYHLKEKLGEGGMGVVYRAQDKHLERDVAVKVLPVGTLADEDARKRFRKEALTLSKLNHPHIATIYDYDTQDGVDFLVMEYVPGETLAEKLKSGPLAEKEVTRLGTQVAAALEEAHEHGVIHRDLKPGNVALTAKSDAKVLDFGIAKLLQSKEDIAEAATVDTVTKTLGVAGTLPYMAPEQLRGKEADARTDIWALGVLLYEAARGERPFQGKTGHELGSAILNQRPAPLPPNVSSVLHAVIERCLEKEPGQRYQRPGEVRAALETIQTGAVAPRVAARPTRLWWWAAGAGAALVVLVAVFVLFRFARPEAPAQALTIKPLTSFVGWEWAATWSPDASFIAYGHTKYGHFDIFVMSTGGGEPIRLTTSPADDMVPRWSSDNRYIAFLSDRGTGINVYLIPPLGGPERKLAETHISWLNPPAGALGTLGAFPWSPDASELLFSRLRPSGEIAVWKINLNTGDQTQLTKPPPGAADLNATWSFDGERIAFRRNQGGRLSLWLMDAPGGPSASLPSTTLGTSGASEPELLLGDEYQNTEPAWAPDSQRLVFVSNRAGARNLWEIDIGSGRLRQLTSGPEIALLPATSPSGGVAYAPYSHQLDLYWGRVDQPQEEHQRLTSHTRDNIVGRVSPDGQQIVYYSDRTGNYELWLLDRATGAERQLTDHPATDGMADWSPDGREIVFLSDREGTLQLWVLAVESGRLRRLSEKSFSIQFQPHFGGPRWSPDGKAIGFIAAGEKGEALWVVDPQGENVRSVLSGVIGFDWYRTSHHVVYTRTAPDGSGTLEMRAADLETGKEAILLTGPSAELVVAPDGRGVAYVHAASHYNMHLYLLRLAPPAAPGELPRPVGKPRQLTRGEGIWHVHNGGWSPDSKALVYSRDLDSGDIYVIENYR